MADYLDYGEPDPSGASALAPLPYDDSPLTPTMRGTEEDDDIDMREHNDDDDNDRRNNRRRSASPSNRRQHDGAAKLYPYPAELGIEAGARRGPQASPSEAGQQDSADGAVHQAWNEEADHTPPEVPAPIGGGQDVRLSAIHLTGNPISKLSTSRLFAYVTHYGAQPLGLEWINDTSVNVVFAVPSAARLALEYICPATASSSAPLVPLPSLSEFDIIAEAQREYKEDRDSSGAFVPWPQTVLEALLIPREAHRFPSTLYTGIERDYAAQAQILRDESPGTSTIPDDAPDIYREMAAEERKKAWNSPEMDHLKRIQGTIWARFALESADVKVKRAKAESKWYQEHGFAAGKEVVPRMLEVGAVGEKVELLTKDGEQGGSRDHGSAYTRVRGRGATHRTAMDSLDEELDLLRATREISSLDRRSASPVRGAVDSRRHGYDARPSSSSGSSIIRRDRGPHAAAARSNLDEEMDQWKASRDQISTMDHAKGSRELLGAAAITAGSDTGIKVRGRGRHKAPSSKMSGWSDDFEGGAVVLSTASDTLDDFGRSGSLRNGSDSGSHNSDGRRQGGHQQAGSLARRLGGGGILPSLEDRLQTRQIPSLAARLGDSRSH